MKKVVNIAQQPQQHQPMLNGDSMLTLNGEEDLI